MKKLIMGAVLAVVLTAASFAQAGYSALGGHVSLPIAFTTTKITSDYKLKGTQTNVGFGINGMSMFTDFIGLYSTMDITFILNQTSRSVINGNKSDKDKAKRGDIYKSQVGVDMLIGPAIKLLYTDNMFLYVAPGLHYQMGSAKYKAGGTTTGFLVGAGATVGFDYSVAQKVALQAGIDTAFDFLAFGDYKNGDMKMSAFVFSPKIGAAYKF